MKPQRHNIIYFLYSIVGKYHFLNQLVKNFYLFFLIPLIEFFLIKKHSNLIKIVPRGSISGQFFNAFLSDIDTILIVEKNVNSSALINSFLKLKKIFIMFDIPEIYTEDEYLLLEEMKQKDEWNLVQLCWHIRKIAWCNFSILNTPNSLTLAKNLRAIDSSWCKILKKDIPTKKKKYLLSELVFLEEIIPINNSEIKTCYYSHFLATSQNSSFVLELSLDQFYYINSLMPGENIYLSIKQEVSPFFLSCKRVLSINELFLTRSALRLKEAIGEDTCNHLVWCEQLKKSLDRLKFFTNDQEHKSTHMN